MTNVDKAESIASPKISSSIPLISMWVLLEGNPSSVKINVNPSDFASQRPDLNDLKPILKEEFDELKNVAKGKIEFFADKDRTQSLLSDVALATLKTNASSPLIVRYPLSTSSIVVTYKYGNSKESYEMPHFGGSWSLLQEDVIESFRSLSKFENAQARDVYFEIPDRENKKIKNEFQFNALVIQTEVNEGKRVLPEFKVFIKGKKPYSEWEINDVLREILHQDSISDLQTFDLNDLPESKLLTEEELNLFVDVIQQTLYVFKNKVDVNEATTREYISTFMKTAVRHIQTYTNGTAELFVEDNLNGTRGYGPVDYLVKHSNTAVLVNEAKTNNITKGLAQTITQLHTMREKLGKRKLGQTEFESSPLFGIVSTGNQWLFVRWTGSVESPTVEISKKISCEFVGSMQNAKDVASYIVRILQTQNDEFQKNNLKRVRIDQGSS